MSDFEFPDCMHGMAAAFHMLRIDPADVEISLALPKWWELFTAIDRKYKPGLVRFDGRGLPPSSFQYMGFRFVGKTAENATVSENAE